MTALQVLTSRVSVHDMAFYYIVSYIARNIEVYTLKLTWFRVSRSPLFADNTSVSVLLPRCIQHFMYSYLKQ